MCTRLSPLMTQVFFHFNCQKRPQLAEQLLDCIFKRILVRIREAIIINKEDAVISNLELLGMYLSLEEVARFFLYRSVYFINRKLSCGIDIQLNTLFCVALGISFLPNESDKQIEYFTDSLQKGRESNEIQLRALRQKIDVVVCKVHSMLEQLVLNKNIEGRSAIIEWFTWVTIHNKCPLQRHAHYKNMYEIIRSVNRVAHESFQINFLYLILKFASPFCKTIEAVQEKIVKVDTDVLIRHEGVFKDFIDIVSEEEVLTQVVEKQQPPKLQKMMSGSSPFLSDVARIAINWINICRPIYSHYIAIIKQVSKMNQKNDMSSQQRQKILAKKLCYDCQIHNPQLVELQFSFFMFESYLAFYLISQSVVLQFDQIPELPTLAYCKLPESILKDMVLYVQAQFYQRDFILQRFLRSIQYIISFWLLAQGHKNFCSNYYLRSKILKVLVLFLHEEAESESLEYIFNQTEYCLHHMISSLVQIFVDCEFTGSHTQFYDKF